MILDELLRRADEMLVINRVAAWGMLVALVVLTVVPPNIRPVTPLPHSIEHAAFPHGIEHAATFLLAGIRNGPLSPPSLFTSVARTKHDPYQLCLGTARATNRGVIRQYPMIADEAGG
jgi:hypothetical protein